MANFTGQLNANAIHSGIYNMIISQRVFADDIYDTKDSLLNMAKVDGGLYGDTKLYYSTDILKSYEWGNDAEATNLLKLYRPTEPKVQKITLDIFRQIPITIDNYLTKQAWADEGAFSAFNSRVLSWINDTKRVYDATTYNAFLGTHAATGANQNITISIPKDIANQPEVNARIEAQTLAKAVSDIFVDIEDISRRFNDNEFVRSYNTEDLILVFNSKWANKITKMDVPTIYHKEDLFDRKMNYRLPARFFGNINTSAGDAPSNNTTIRALSEMDFNTAKWGESGYDPKKHIFGGDLLPNSAHYDANTTYTEDANIVFVAYINGSTPYMSAFEVGTSWFNPKSLTETHYLTWGRNHLTHLSNYPFIRVKAQKTT